MRKEVLLALPMLLLFFGTTAQTVSQEIRTLMDYCVENDMFNGNIAVVDNGELVFMDSYGYSDPGAKLEMSTKSSFYLASVSKHFTCLAIMLLKERGQLEYENTLASYYDDFPDYAKDVTIRHMMTHTSGIPDHYRLGAYKKGLTNQDVYDILVQQQSLDFTPGEKYQYSNGAYVLLSMIVEEVSGEKFDDFMKKNILKPAGLKHTLVYNEPTDVVKHRTVAYDDKGELADYEIFTVGAGGMFSTIKDMVAWDEELYENDIVSAETMAEALVPTKLNNGEISYYGFGWRLSDNPEEMQLTHTGSMGGYKNYFFRDLDNKDAIIMLTNNGAFVRGEIAEAIQHILDGEEYEMPE